jgi:hypothetical protein
MIAADACETPCVAVPKSVAHTTKPITFDFIRTPPEMSSSRRVRLLASSALSGVIRPWPIRAAAASDVRQMGRKKAGISA